MESATQSLIIAPFVKSKTADLEIFQQVLSATMSSASSVLVTTKRFFALEILTMIVLVNFIQITSGDSYDVSRRYFVHIKGSASKTSRAVPSN